MSEKERSLLEYTGDKDPSVGFLRVFKAHQRMFFSPDSLKNAYQFYKELASSERNFLREVWDYSKIEGTMTPQDWLHRLKLVLLMDHYKTNYPLMRAQIFFVTSGAFFVLVSALFAIFTEPQSGAMMMILGAVFTAIGTWFSYGIRTLQVNNSFDTVPLVRGVLLPIFEMLTHEGLHPSPVTLSLDLSRNENTLRSEDEPRLREGNDSLYREFANFSILSMALSLPENVTISFTISEDVTETGKLRTSGRYKGTYYRTYDVKSLFKVDFQCKNESIPIDFKQRKTGCTSWETSKTDDCFHATVEVQGEVKEASSVMEVSYSPNTLFPFFEEAYRLGKSACTESSRADRTSARVA